MVAACARCGQRLGGWHLKGTLCTRCAAEDAQARYEREAELARPVTCPGCGEAFVRTSLTQRTCSARCRKRVWREEQRAARV